MADGALLMEPTPANIPIIAKFKAQYPMISKVYRANLIKFQNSPYVQNDKDQSGSREPKLFYL